MQAERALLRFETPLGQQSQIDWGQATVPFRADPQVVFVLTLGFSRSGFYYACAYERLARFSGHTNGPLRTSAAIHGTISMTARAPCAMLIKPGDTFGIPRLKLLPTIGGIESKIGAILQSPQLEPQAEWCRPLAETQDTQCAYYQKPPDHS